MMDFDWNSVFPPNGGDDEDFCDDCGEPIEECICDEIPDDDYEDSEYEE